MTWLRRLFGHKRLERELDKELSSSRGAQTGAKGEPDRAKHQIMPRAQGVCSQRLLQTPPLKERGMLIVSGYE
jgi:hypothetical protein